MENKPNKQNHDNGSTMQGCISLEDIFCHNNLFFSHLFLTLGQEQNSHRTSNPSYSTPFLPPLLPKLKPYHCFRSLSYFSSFSGLCISSRLHAFLESRDGEAMMLV